MARACTDAYVFKDTEESNFKVEKPIENKENPDFEVNQYLLLFILKSELDNNNEG